MNSLEEKRKFYIDVVETGDSLLLRDISDLCIDMLDFTNLRSGCRESVTPTKELTID